MELTKLEAMKLAYLSRAFAGMTLDEVAILYKETTQIYLTLPMGDIAEDRFRTQMTELQQYGNLLTLSKCEDENAMDYEVEVHGRNSQFTGMAKADLQKLVKEIGRTCLAYVDSPLTPKWLFYDVMFITPYATQLLDKTDHVLIKEFLKEYGLKYRRTAPQFTYAFK